MENLKTGVSRKQITPNFPKNKHFLPPDTQRYVCVSGLKKCLFFGKFGVFSFLEILVLRFVVLTYYGRFLLVQSVLFSILCFRKILIYSMVNFGLYGTLCVI